jgi:hypothetical protein
MLSKLFFKKVLEYYYSYSYFIKSEFSIQFNYNFEAYKTSNFLFFSYTLCHLSIFICRVWEYIFIVFKNVF